MWWGQLCAAHSRWRRRGLRDKNPPEGFDTVLLDFLRAGLTWEIIKSEPVGGEPLQARRQAVRRPETSQGSRPATRQRLQWRGEAARRWEVHGNGNLRTLSVLAPSLKSNSLPHMESHKVTPRQMEMSTPGLNHTSSLMCDCWSLKHAGWILRRD